MKFKDIKDVVASEGGAFLKLQDGPNKVRIVGEFFQMWKVFKDGKATTILDVEEAKTVKDAKMRFAMYVIERSSSEVKIAEFGPSIMGQIADLSESEEYKFDDLPPYDITITKEGAGMDTEYKVMPARTNTALTPEEQAKVLAMPSLEEHYGKSKKSDVIPF